MSDQIVYVCAGDQLNLLERVAQANIVITPAADANFPLTNIYDRKGSNACRFGSLALNSNIVVDGNLILNGNMESPGVNGGALSTWVVQLNGGTGSVTESNTQAHTGTYSMKLVPDATHAVSASQTITVRSGERFTLSVFLYGDNTNPVFVTVQNLETGNYLKPNGGWQAASINAFTKTTTGWGAGGGPIVSTIEAVFPLADLMSLQITVGTGASTSTGVFADDVYYWPSVDHYSVHGIGASSGGSLTNLEPSLTAEFDSAPDNATWTTQNSPTMQRPVLFYSPLTPVDVRYTRFQINGTPQLRKPFLGEFVLSQKLVVTQGPLTKMPTHYLTNQIRPTGVLGDVFAYKQDAWHQREIDLGFDFVALSRMQQWRDMVWLRSGEGSIPIILIPYSADPEICILGDIGGKGVPTFSYTRGGRAEVPTFFEGAKVTVRERPHPTFVT